jgi:D-cysteine desulfhydrase
MIEEQNITNFIDDIVVTAGSGGTMSALAIANYMTGSQFNLHAFCVCDSSSYFYDHLNNQLIELFGFDHKINVKSMVKIVSCSKGLGYSKSTKEELDFLVKIFKMTGILLDPVYTGKTAYTLFNLINKNKPTLSYQNDEMAQSFLKNLKGNRILFMHTGGQLGVFSDGKFDSSLALNQKKSIYNCFDENMNLFDL